MRRLPIRAVVLLLLAAPGVAAAQNAVGVPTRQIPPSVLAELQELEHKFEQALAADCAQERCFSKGCTYVDHAVADQPRAGSLPGLGQDPGPGSVAAQEYLTRARCSFAHEETVTGKDVQALIRRLQSKLSKAWTTVMIDHQQLEPIPASLQEAPAEPEPPPEPEPAALAVEQPWSIATAARELWTMLLPHLWWMVGVVLVTFAGTVLVWAWRRVGRESLEERALMAQLGQGGGPQLDDGVDGADGAPAEEEDLDYVARQAAAWHQRLEAASRQSDPELQALIRELLRSRELDLLAKAVMQFPDTFLAAFPAGGDVASAKLELADHLKAVDADDLPSDTAFFRALDRHARSAALAAQSDAQLVRSLRDEFGATGLVALVGAVPPRIGAVLFALAPAEHQHEMVRLLSSRQMGDMAEQLLRSNRMPKSETAYLFRLLEAARADEPLPAAPAGEVSDRGAEFDAASALSVLLPSLPTAKRTALFAAALQRYHGSLPAWTREIFVADLLGALPDEARTDLLLELDAESLAAWLSLLPPDPREALTEGLPDALRASLSSFSSFSSRSRQLGVADRARRELARGFQRQLSRLGIPFERAVAGEVAA